MKRKIISVCIILIIMIFSSVSISAEDGNNAKVKFFNKDIVINGEKIINHQSSYPYFVYNDIIYFPITWENGKILGFETKWDQQAKTLEIIKCEPTQKNYGQRWLKFGKAYLTAAKSQVTVISDGKKIDTSGYPLFDYNNVTYVPLTYSAVSEFWGWDMYYDPYAGLYLSTNGVQTAKSMVDQAAASYNRGLAKYIRQVNGNLTEEQALELAMIIRQKAQIYDLEDFLLAAVMHKESNFNPSCGRNGGPIGLMQIMPGTGARYGLTPQMLYDPNINADFGAMYLKEHIDSYKGDVKKALSAYNQGSTKVNRGSYSTRYYEGVMSKYSRLENYMINNGYMKQ